MSASQSGLPNFALILLRALLAEQHCMFGHCVPLQGRSDVFFLLLFAEH